MKDLHAMKNMSTANLGRIIVSMCNHLKIICSNVAISDTGFVRIETFFIIRLRLINTKYFTKLRRPKLCSKSLSGVKSLSLEQPNSQTAEVVVNSIGHGYSKNKFYLKQCSLNFLAQNTVSLTAMRNLASRSF